MAEHSLKHTPCPLPPTQGQIHVLFITNVNYAADRKPHNLDRFQTCLSECLYLTLLTPFPSHAQSALLLLLPA